MEAITYLGQVFFPGKLRPTYTPNKYTLDLYKTEEAREKDSTLKRKVEKLLYDYPQWLSEYNHMKPSTTAPFRDDVVQSNRISDSTAELAVKMADIYNEHLRPVEEGVQLLNENCRKFVEQRYFKRKTFKAAWLAVPCSEYTAAEWLNKFIIPTFGKLIEEESNE